MKVGGGSLVKRPCGISEDGKRVLCCSGNNINVFSVITGEQLTVLKGHTKEVTSVVPLWSSMKSGDSVSLLTAWSSSLDGTLRLWDYSNSTQLRVLKIGYGVESMVIPESKSQESDSSRETVLRYAYLSVWFCHTTKEVEKKAGHVIAVDLVTGKKKEAITKTKKPHELYSSTSGRLIGLLSENKALIFRAPSQASFSMQDPNPRSFVLRHSKVLTTLAFSPTDTDVVAGDSMGRVVVFNGVGQRLPLLQPKPTTQGDDSKSDDGNALTSAASPRARKSKIFNELTIRAVTKMHWHASGVLSLVYSSDGAYLISGGSEAVLVTWQLETGARNFLPRLGGAILSIVRPSSVSKTRNTPKYTYLLQCSDNAIRLVDLAAMRVQLSICGVKPQLNLKKTDLGGAQPAGITSDSSGRLAIPNIQGGVQIFDTQRGSQVTDIKVSSRNFVPLTPPKPLPGVPPPTATHLSPVWVTRVAFSLDGLCMATVELRRGTLEDYSTLGQSECLKIWQIVRGGAGTFPSSVDFRMNTIVENPHVHMTVAGLNRDLDLNPGGPLLTSALAFHPSGNLVLSAAAAAPPKPLRGNGEEASWKEGFEGGEFKIWEKVGGKNGGPFCFRCRSVGGYRKLPIYAGSFSGDGSLFALGMSQGTVTLWDPQTCQLLQVVRATPVAEQPLTRLDFLDSTPFILTATDQRIVVLDLLTFGVWWALRLNVAGVAKGPLGHFAVLGTIPRDLRTAGKEEGKKGKAKSSGGFLFVFHGEHPKPISTWSVRDFRGASVVWGGANSAREITLLTKDSEYVCFDPFSEEEGTAAEPKPTENGVQTAENDESGYEAMYGKLQEKSGALGDQGNSIPSEVSKKPWGDMLEGPSHILPPLQRICSSFVDSMLEKISLENA